MPRTPDVAILCGGMGTRLRPVLGGRPKALAMIGGRPFLHRLIDHLVREGCRRIILCTGVGRDAIRASLEHQPIQTELIFAEETDPLGTGGAVRNCLPWIQTEEVIVMNGDSFTDVSFERIWNHPADGRVRLVAVPADERQDAGTLQLDEQGRVTQFQEKAQKRCGPYLNAGIYSIPRALLTEIPGATVFSMEHDLLPGWVKVPGIQAIVHPGDVVDIGTPDRFKASQRQLSGRL